MAVCCISYNLYKRWTAHPKAEAVDQTVQLFAKVKPWAGISENTQLMNAIVGPEVRAPMQYFKDEMMKIELPNSSVYVIHVLNLTLSSWVKDAERVRLFLIPLVGQVLNNVGGITDNFKISFARRANSSLILGIFINKVISHMINFVEQAAVRSTREPTAALL